MDVRMAVLRYVVNGGDPRFAEPYLVMTVRQRAQCTRDQVWEALWGLAGGGLIYLDPDKQRHS
jgi:hypothetical protein